MIIKAENFGETLPATIFDTMRIILRVDGFKVARQIAITILLLFSDVHAAVLPYPRAPLRNAPNLECMALRARNDDRTRHNRTTNQKMHSRPQRKNLALFG